MLSKIDNPIDAFQSTRPSRASTSFSTYTYPSISFQSTRPSRASTLMLCTQHITMIFQSTRPSRASTQGDWEGAWNAIISIHKALAGLDTDAGEWWSDERLFQSTRPSRASTLPEHILIQKQQIFQSTRPSRASTRNHRASGRTYVISIHKALAGLDF